MLPLVGSMIVSARAQPALMLRRLDHAQTDAVLDAATGIEGLELRPDLPAQTGELRESGEPDHRRRPDQVECGAGNLARERHECVVRDRRG